MVSKQCYALVADHFAGVAPPYCAGAGFLTPRHGGVQVTVGAASATTGGLPPGSGHYLLRHFTTKPVAYLGDFDTQFSTQFYNSRYDVGATLEVGAVRDAAVLLARALHVVGSGKEDEVLPVS